ncbi:SMP-30/Gluconolaconase/LRE-like region-domain-containing protein [Hyaloraphidium curvatum]|nr:SMP-30/Gluconolaconase/LRE-like region-domain-containing protein [Hyaloraphidium curvatum]
MSVPRAARPLHRPSAEADRFLPESPRALVLPSGAALAWTNIQTARDATAGGVHVLRGGAAAAVRVPGRPGFIVPTERPGVVLVGATDRVGLLDLAGAAWTPLAAVPGAGERVPINDGEATPDGSAVVFGTKDANVLDGQKKFSLDLGGDRVAFGQPRPKGKLYLYTPGDNRVSVLAEGMSCSNGKVFSRAADGSLTLYDIDSLRRNVTAYPLDISARTLGPGRVSADLSRYRGVPDGMCAAGDGTAVVALFDPSASPTGLAVRIELEGGREVERWEVPGSPRVTCPLLVPGEGGNGAKLVLTTAVEGMPDRMRAVCPEAGTLFEADTDLRGVPEPAHVVMGSLLDSPPANGEADLSKDELEDDPRKLRALLDLGSLLDGLVEESQMERRSLGETLARVLPELCGFLGARGAFVRSFGEDLALGTFKHPADLEIPDEQGVLHAAGPEERGEVARMVGTDLVLARSMDVAGEWFGTAGLVVPAEAMRWDETFMGRCLQVACEELDNFLFAIRAAREKHRVMMELADALRHRVLGEGLVQAVRALSRAVPLDRVLLVCVAEEETARTLHVQLFEQGELRVDTMGSLPPPDDESEIKMEAGGYLRGGDRALLRRFAFEHAQEEVLINGVTHSTVVGKVLVTSRFGSFNTYDRELLAGFAGFVRQRVVDFNKEWRNLARSFRAEDVARLLQSDDYRQRYLGPREEVVAMLYVDIAGFTRISEQVLGTPSAVAALVETWSEQAVQLVWEHGGVFDKMVGDCIIALFGPPFYDVPQGGRLAAAIACAVAIRDMTRALPERPGFEAIRAAGGLGVSTGVNLAPLFVGTFGPNDNFTGFSSGMNNTARLQHCAERDEILVMSGSLSALPEGGHGFEFGPEREAKVKNVAEPLKFRPLPSPSLRTRRNRNPRSPARNGAKMNTPPRSAGSSPAAPLEPALFLPERAFAPPDEPELLLLPGGLGLSLFPAVRPAEFAAPTPASQLPSPPWDAPAAFPALPPVPPLGLADTRAPFDLDPELLHLCSSGLGIGGPAVPPGALMPVPPVDERARGTVFDDDSVEASEAGDNDAQDFHMPSDAKAAQGVLVLVENGRRKRVYANSDEEEKAARKRARNTESARRARVRRAEQVRGLTDEIGRLRAENAALRAQLAAERRANGHEPFPDHLEQPDYHLQPAPSSRRRNSRTLKN